MNLRITLILPGLLLLSLPVHAAPSGPKPRATSAALPGAKSRLTGITMPPGAVLLQNPGAIERMKSGFGSAVGKPVSDLEFFAWSGGSAALRAQISAKLKAAGYVITPMPSLAAPGILAFSVSGKGHVLYEIWSRDSTLADVTFFRTIKGDLALTPDVSTPTATAPPPYSALPPVAVTGNGKAWAAKGYTALNAKKYNAAATDYLKALAAEPHNAEYLYNMGVAMDGLKHYKSAADAYRTAVYLKPDILDARTNLGVDLIRLKKYPEAIKVLQDATIRQSDDALAFRALGDAYLQSGQARLAAASYRGATRLAPGDAATYKSLGDALGKLGKTDEAIAAYAQAVRLDPKLRPVATAPPTATVVANSPDSADPPGSIVPSPGPTPAVPLVPTPPAPTNNPPTTLPVLPVDNPPTVSPTVPPTDTAPVVAASSPPPGVYRCTWTHLDAGDVSRKSDFMGRFTLKSDGTYTWMDGAEPGTYAYDPATQEITFTGGHLGRDGVKARLHQTRAGGPLIFVSFSTDYTRTKRKDPVLWTCVPEDAGAGL